MNFNTNFPTTYVQTIKVRKSVPISTTTIDEEVIGELISQNLAEADIATAEDLDNQTSSSITNLRVDSIGASSKTFVSIDSDMLIKSNVLIGSTEDTALNPLYKLQVNGSFYLKGEEVYLNANNVRITDNVIGIGVNNTSLGNFINGLYFPKTDAFSGLGISPNKIGMLAFPFGVFQSSTIFAQSNSTLKRFNNNKSNIRFAYIDDSVDLENQKTSDNPFTIDEMNYINSLNNTNSIQSNFYVNIECDNITCHGGNFISGLSKDLVLMVTDGNNFEIPYIICSLSNSTIQFEKNLEVMISDFEIQNESNIFIKTKNSSDNDQFSFSNTGHRCLRTLDFSDNNSVNANISFGNSTGATQKTLQINYQFTPMINIDANTNTNNKIELKTKTEVSGPDPDSNHYPILSYYNSNPNNVISTSYPPIVKNFIQSKLIQSSSNQTFIFSDLLNTSYTNLVFVAYIMCSNELYDKHLSLKIEGLCNVRSSGGVTINIDKTETVLSIKDITYTDSNSPDLTVLVEGVKTTDYSTTTNDFKIKVTNNLSISFNTSIKVEFIQM